MASTDIPIYVINLDRAQSRFAHVEREMAAQSLPFHRIPAIDAETLGPEDIARARDAELERRSYHATMQRGEIACFLSHRLAWRTLLGSPAPFAVVLEDDFSWLGDAMSVVDALRNAGEPDWDVVKLFGRKRRVVRSVRRLTDTFSLIREPFISKFCVGQVVSRRGAERLLAGTLPMHRPVDVQMQYPWELGIDVLTIAPSLVRDVGDELGGSTTKRRATLAAGARLRREARRVYFRGDRFWRSLLYFMRKR